MPKEICDTYTDHAEWLAAMHSWATSYDAELKVYGDESSASADLDFGRHSATCMVGTWNEDTGGVRYFP